MTASAQEILTQWPTFYTLPTMLTSPPTVFESAPPLCCGLLLWLAFTQIVLSQEESSPNPAVSRAAVAESAQPLGQGTPQVVVLHNDSAIQGRVERSADRLVVSNGPWYVVQIPLADVDFVAPNFAAAYRTKRDRLTDRDFQRHLDLAQWCLRQDLDRFAADQLLHLAKLDSHHPAVEALEQQLRRRANQVEVDAHVDAQPASFGVDRNPPQIEAPESADERPIVSPEALAEYTRSIQPLLLNRCGQTTCHGSSSRSVFQLQRLAPVVLPVRT